jgi:WD40 repeat protein
MKTRIPNVHESTITSCQFSMSDDRVITTSTDKTTKFFDLVSHRSTMTLRYMYISRHRLAFLSINDARQENIML